MAGIEEDIAKLPKGQNTLVNYANMHQFSQSFIKSIGHARHYLRNKDIFLMDTPTEGLNQQAKVNFLNYINGLKKKKTIVIVSSDREYFSIADKVLWLDQGRVKKFGSSKEVYNVYKKAV